MILSLLCSKVSMLADRLAGNVRSEHLLWRVMTGLRSKSVVDGTNLAATPKKPKRPRTSGVTHRE
jgi:hypothetical protein